MGEFAKRNFVSSSRLIHHSGADISAYPYSDFEALAAFLDAILYIAAFYGIKVFFDVVAPTVVQTDGQTETATFVGPGIPDQCHLVKETVSF